MNFLEDSFSLDISKLQILGRKVSIKGERSIIYGPPKCGKTFLMLSKLKEEKRKKFLYIDCQDPRCDVYEVNSYLENFIRQKNIDLLAFDNYHNDIFIPNVKQILLTMSIPKNGNFETIKLRPLDFEEYLSFEKKDCDIINSFNNFLKYGNFPETPFLPNFLKLKKLQELSIIINKDETSFFIFRELSNQIGKKITTFMLFTKLKNLIKISKNRIYDFIKFLQDMEIIFLIPHLRELKAPKKLFLYNFAFPNAISADRDFLLIFQNIIFLELKARFCNIYYDQNIDFYIMDNFLIVLSIPFANNVQILQKLELLKGVEASKIEVVTLNTQGRGNIYGIEYEILPFWEWTLGR